MTRIGVLALQGAFIEHEQILRGLGVEVRQVRLPHHLENLDGLIIPGGESTTIGKLAVGYGLIEPIRELARCGAPVWGTCAGMIILARKVLGHEQPLVGLMDIVVRRNAFGGQVDSFVEDLQVPAFGQDARPFPGVFIRAPLIEWVGPGVEILVRLPEGGIVAVRQGNLLATAFHPELTSDTRFHRYFLAMTDGWAESGLTAAGSGER
ncbi:MAG: pyridoxal 5'-phosphate synthase glutaminase subunit PdxT [Anaerolineae bacterium]|nr:pyridoxal 5'-phosphate synthase glutaminase subunit PdxT [Anaerolineae bacterium]